MHAYFIIIIRRIVLTGMFHNYIPLQHSHLVDIHPRQSITSGSYTMKHTGTCTPHTIYHNISDKQPHHIHQPAHTQFSLSTVMLKYMILSPIIINYRWTIYTHSLTYIWTDLSSACIQSIVNGSSVCVLLPRSSQLSTHHTCQPKG